MRPENCGMDVLSAIFVSIKRLEILVEGSYGGIGRCGGGWVGEKFSTVADSFFAIGISVASLIGEWGCKKVLD